MKYKTGLINRACGAALDLIYPEGLYCISCGKIIDDSRTYRLCDDCMKSVNWITDRHCARCGKPLSENNPGELCFSCTDRIRTDREPAFDRGFACAGYGACEQAVIFSFKYGYRSDIGDTLGEIMYDRMTAEFEPDELSAMYDMVVPVPVFKEKKKKRGFNHAELMAEAFAKRAGIKCEPDLIIRTRETLPMKGLSPGERRDNVSGAFAVRERKKALTAGACILIVDDIYTTGSTIEEIASLLSDAARVDFLTFAAGADLPVSE